AKIWILEAQERGHLQQIFASRQFGVHTAATQSLALINSMPVTPNNDVLLEIFELFVSMDDDGPFKIFFLSKTWRATVLSHPSLWSWITVDATREDWQERIHTSIALSQNCSLHLTIKCEDSIPPDLFQLNKEGFARVRTITLHVLDDEHLKQNVLDLHSNRIIANIDKVEQLFSKDSNAGTTVIISNIGIVKWVKNQDWLKAGDPEPPIDATHPFVRDGVLPADAESVFEAFLDRHLQHAYCCMWAADGTWCRRVSSPRPRAVNHTIDHSAVMESVRISN
ncbi:hypothetical protein FRC17_003898, partial [Serendipita sp. 399]